MRKPPWLPLAPLAIAAATLAAYLLPASPAGAAQIPAVDPYSCPNPDGMNGITIWGCQLEVAPKVWRYMPAYQWQVGQIPFTMVVRHWTSWGGFDAVANGTVTTPTGSFAASVEFTFPVTFRGHLVYAGYSFSPINPAVAEAHPGYSQSGVAL